MGPGMKNCTVSVLFSYRFAFAGWFNFLDPCVFRAINTFQSGLKLEFKLMLFGICAGLAFGSCVIEESRRQFGETLPPLEIETEGAAGVTEWIVGFAAFS